MDEQVAEIMNDLERYTFSLNQVIPQIWTDTLIRRMREQVVRSYKIWWDSLSPREQKKFEKKKHNRKRYARYLAWVSKQAKKQRKSRSR